MALVAIVQRLDRLSEDLRGQRQAASEPRDRLEQMPEYDGGLG